MKRSRFIHPILLLLATAMLAACDDTDAPTEHSGGPLSARVDGQPWAPPRSNATFVNGTLSITAARQREYNVEAGEIDLNIINVTAPGVYPLGGLSGNSGHLRRDTTNYYTALLALNSVAGAVTITHLDATSVSGTFYFTAHRDGALPPADSAVVTDGSFSIALTR